VDKKATWKRFIKYKGIFKITKLESNNFQKPCSQGGITPTNASNNGTYRIESTLAMAS